MRRLIGVLAVLLGLIVPPSTMAAAEIEYPQIIKTRYEAADPKNGGSFEIFSEREKIVYGLGTKVFPGARFVEILQITPTVGSITLTFVEIRTVASAVSDYIHLTGNVRFRISGMLLQSSNFPPGSP